MDIHLSYMGFIYFLQIEKEISGDALVSISFGIAEIIKYINSFGHNVRSCLFRFSVLLVSFYSFLLNLPRMFLKLYKAGSDVIQCLLSH